MFFFRETFSLLASDITALALTEPYRVIHGGGRKRMSVLSLHIHCSPFCMHSTRHLLPSDVRVREVQAQN